MANPLATFTKGPTEVLDYTFDFTKNLGTDIISTVTWTVPAGINNTATMNASTTATIWLGGGTAGTNYAVSVTIVTVAGRTIVRSMQINVVTR